MKLKFSVVPLLCLLALNPAMAEPTGKVDRSVQLYPSAKLVDWNRENAGGGKGPLNGRFAYTRHQTESRDAFQEIGWLTLPKGASIGLHGHTDNEDAYIIVSGKGVFTDAQGRETPVSAGDVTIARPGQKHALRNSGSRPLVFINVVAKTAAAQAVAAPSAVFPSAKHPIVQPVVPLGAQ